MGWLQDFRNALSLQPHRQQPESTREPYDGSDNYGPMPTEPAFLGEKFVINRGQPFALDLFWNQPDPFMDEIRVTWVAESGLHVYAPWGTHEHIMMQLAEREIDNRWMAIGNLQQIFLTGTFVTPEEARQAMLHTVLVTPAVVPELAVELVEPEPSAPVKRMRQVICYDETTREVIYKDVPIDE